jgi:hypothetical protein
MPLPSNYIHYPSLFYCHHYNKHADSHLPKTHPRSKHSLIQSSRSSNEVKFPEDIQVILRADRQQSGSLYMGNI